MMRSVLIFFLIISTVTLLSSEALLDEKKLPRRTPTHAAGSPLRTKMTINRISAWYNSHGTEEASTGNAGLTYPAGTAGAVWTGGLVWGGMHYDGRTPVLRVNGSSYNTGVKRGAILGIRTGMAEDPNNPDVRIWRIRTDYTTADLRRDASEINTIDTSSVTQDMIDSSRAQYARDWREWPWQKGAPFYDVGYEDSQGNVIGANNNVLDWGEDVNRNGVLDEGEDTNLNRKLDAERPGLANADQVIWWVMNDIGVQQPWTNVETGMEIQVTIWGFAREDALGDAIFKRYRVIYKGIASTPQNATVDSMYLAQWSDPDLGSFSNDLAGCDSVLGLGYVYNGLARDIQYDRFNIPPPAVGYDFVQGPIVRTGNPADIAIFNLRKVAGSRNLPLTAFIYFASGDPYSDPPFNADGGIRWYQILRGLPPTPQGPPDPPPPIDPFTMQRAGPFWAYGDPVTGRGWIDGMIDGPGDRRFTLSSGPFSMAVGDTQELVVAVVGGLGRDNIESVSVFKFNDRIIQLAYDNLFEFPKAPPAPKVKAIPLDRKIVLDWEFDAAAVSATEDSVFVGGYRFEGYTVYQLPRANADTSDGVLLAQFDVVNGIDLILNEVYHPPSRRIIPVPVQFGSDNGIRRTLVVERDELRSKPLVNGQRYYFAVTAYSYTPENHPTKTLESKPLVVEGVPATHAPGTRYPYDVADTIATVTDIVGVNDARVYPVVFDPTRQKGLSYEVGFDTAATGSTIWSLAKVGTTMPLYDSVAIDSTQVAGFRVVGSGFALYVEPPLQGMKSVVDENGDNVFGARGIPPEATYRVLSLDGDSNSLAGRGVRVGRSYELRFDGVGSFAVSIATPSFLSRTIRVPFSAWDVGRSDEETSRKVIAVVRDRDGMSQSWDISPISLELEGTEFSVFEPIYITAVSYSDSVGVNAIRNSLVAVANNRDHRNSAIHDVYIADLDSDSVALQTGGVIRFNKFREIRAGDAKRITLASVTTGDVALARDDVTLVKAFPNPYYGLNTAETSLDQRFITFNHLPARAVIRIYNLAGILAQRLIKDDPTTQYINWDLKNAHGRPVGSGIYIAYIEMQDEAGNDLGKKTLNLAIFQEARF